MNTLRGKAIFYKTSGTTVSGEWYKNKMKDLEVNELFNTGLIKYKGLKKNGKKHGKGIHFNKHPGNLREPFDYRDFNQLGDNWVKYEGNFEKGVREGQGTLFLTTAEKITGEWCENMLEGKASFYKTDGSIITAEWYENKTLNQDITDFYNTGLIQYKG